MTNAYILNALGVIDFSVLGTLVQDADDVAVLFIVCLMAMIIGAILVILNDKD